MRERLRVEVRRFQKRVGITAIYVTHDQEEALAIADRVVLMNAGRVIQSGTPEDDYPTRRASSPRTSCAVPLGYALARWSFPGRTAILLAFPLPQAFP